MMNRVTSLPPPQILASRKAIVWLTDTHRVTQPDLLARYETLLDDEEQRHYRAFRFDDDRRLYLISHALLRTTLSRYSGTAPADWRFTKGEFGRPEIANPLQGEEDIGFSLSHTKGLAACAVTREADLGIDVEQLDRTVDGRAIASRCFSRYETEQLEALPNGQRQAGFFEYWTLKEAYVKACGGGLSIPLDGFHFFRDPTSAWRIAFDMATHDEPAKWQFVCTRVMPTHVLSIAIRGRDRVSSEVELRRTVPLSHDASAALSISHT